MSLFQPNSRKVNERERIALVVAIAAEIAGISTSEMLGKINARIDELLVDE